jgi:hypothetical protein
MQLSCKNTTGSLYWADSVMMRKIFIPLLSILLFFAQFPVRSDTVAVAGGLFPCVSELADLYNDRVGESPGLVVGSSGKLASQIAAGAPFGRRNRCFRLQSSRAVVVAGPSARPKCFPRTCPGCDRRSGTWSLWIDSPTLPRESRDLRRLA